MHCAKINAPPEHLARTLLTFALESGGAPETDEEKATVCRPTLLSVSRATQISERTLRRWIRGVTTPRPSALRSLWSWLVAAMDPVYITSRPTGYTIWLLIRPSSWCCVSVDADGVPLDAHTGEWSDGLRLEALIQRARAYPRSFMPPLSNRGSREV